MSGGAFLVLALAAELAVVWLAFNMGLDVGRD